ncbi:MAG: putative zinc-binding metallopeptidase [Nitriliruptoraceae bacterium]
MKVFACPGCGQLVFFANTACLRCGTAFAFDPERLAMVAIGGAVARCREARRTGCNWVAAGEDGRCESCSLTRARPCEEDLTIVQRLRVAEAAKRRLLFQLCWLGLPLEPRDETAGTGVAFDLLHGTDEAPVTTGHLGGVITLDLAESDAVHRERVRTKLSEPYRTVLGHFRHEIGHYFFPVLVAPGDLGHVRSWFGDETRDYQAALDRHYRDGAPAGWAQDHISEYATMHPSEDWAETFAHYLHLRGVLQTAAAYGLKVDGPDLPSSPVTQLDADPTRLDEDDIQDVIGTWLPLSYALNAVSRSMGEDDLYPFVLSPHVMGKLAVIHDLVLRQARITAGAR